MTLQKEAADLLIDLISESAAYHFWHSERLKNLIRQIDSSQARNDETINPTPILLSLRILLYEYRF